MYPIDRISDDDKKNIIDFFEKYQGHNSFKTDVPHFLDSWNNNKIKMFKLLGNELLVEFPISSVENNICGYAVEEALSKAYDNGIFCDINKYYDMKTHIIRPDTFLLKKKITRSLMYALLQRITDNNEYAYLLPIYKALFVSDNDCFRENLAAGKLKSWNKLLSGLTDRITKGMKYPKAIKRLMELVDYHDDYLYTKWLSNYSDLRTMYFSNFNDTKMVLSIHPLDFLGMSHGQDWSTCMSWKTNGCYHAGTVEMMNSNNCIVAYVTDGKLNKDNRPCKLWRCLIFVDKDIIVNGKSYPFGSDELKKCAVKKTYELVHDKFKWDYKFELQRYYDMNIVDDNDNIYERIDENEYDEEYQIPLKTNGIYMRMNGFYNDFSEDHSEHYFCYRNKVNKTKIIVCSGPMTCSCCGNKIENNKWSTWTEDYPGHSHIAMCNECQQKYLCAECDKLDNDNMYTIKTLRFMIDWDCGRSNSALDFSNTVCEVILYHPTKICADCLKSSFQEGYYNFIVYNKNTKELSYDIDRDEILRYNNNDVIIIQYRDRFDFARESFKTLEEWAADGRIESETPICNTVRTKQ